MKKVLLLILLLPLSGCTLKAETDCLQACGRNAGEANIEACRQACRRQASAQYYLP